MNAVVVTSENSAEFYAKRLDLVAPEPVAAPAAEKPAGEPAVESATKTGEATTEAEASEQLGKIPDPEAKQKLNLRFSELTEQRKTAEAKATQAAEEAKAARERAELAERTAAELRAKYEPPKVDGPGAKPERAQFVDDAEHEKALLDWAGEKAIYERDQKDAAAKIERQWNERQTATKAELPDYDAVIAKSANLMVSNQVRDAIVESDVGPKILYHLANNPDLVTELSRASAASALKRIGKLEAQLEKSAPVVETKVEAKPVVAASEISRAPAPINPLKGVSDATGGTQVDSSGKFVGTYAEWKAARKAGKIK